MKVRQVNLNFFYGYRCNYSCYGCFSGSDAITSQDRDPSLEQLMHAIPLAADLFEIESMITLIGGEPFLYWDDRIVPLSLAINQHFPNIRINITTNGHLIGKNLNKIFEIAEMVDNVSITVTRHLRAVDHKVRTIWHAGIDSLINHQDIVKIHDDHYHIKNNINANIYFHDIIDWKSYYYRDSNNRIKPWKTNDPSGSMKYGCTGNVCSTIIENRLYKCPNLATLSNHLAELGQQDDPDWRKYIDYPFVDLEHIDPERWSDFIKSYGLPTDHCDMCSNKTQLNMPWTDRTYQMVFAGRNRL